jgi:hypothetical protein
MADSAEFDPLRPELFGPMPHAAPGVKDLRGRFREVACAVLEFHRLARPETEPCDRILRRIGDEQGANGRPVAREPLNTNLVAGVVPGLAWDCFRNWVDYDKAFAELGQGLGHDCEIFPVNGFSGSRHNAREIRDQIMSGEHTRPQKSLVLFGYSKGANDILEALVLYPEIHRFVAAMVSVAGTIGGTPLAEQVDDDTLQVLKYLTGTDCREGDGLAVQSLRPSVRRAWLDSNPLPGGIKYYTLATLPEPGEVSRLLKISYKKLARFDPRNDSQVLLGDQLVPGSTFLAYLNADHWAVGVPFAEAHPVLSALLVDQNRFPRQALLKSAMHVICEDLAEG